MMPQKLVKVARLLVLGLGVVIFATFKNAAIAGEEDLCSAMGYVDIVTKRVPLKARPSQNAHSVVLIHKNQYVCILEQKSAAVNWVKVKAVPVADDSHGGWPLRGKNEGVGTLHGMAEFSNGVAQAVEHQRSS